MMQLLLNSSPSFRDGPKGRARNPLFRIPYANLNSFCALR
jgi:hypothetical protein